MDMEKKLANYRARKARRETLNKYNNKFQSFLNKIIRRTETKTDEDSAKSLLSETSITDLETLPKQHSPHLSDEEEFEDPDVDDDSINCFSYVDLIYYALCLVLWGTIYAIFIKLEFGTVYFIVSVLFFIYFNTRTRPKKANEVSAYSVFNANCESIDGTLKAEQLQREMIYGFAGIH